jgi:hypothetical protein
MWDCTSLYCLLHIYNFSQKKTAKDPSSSENVGYPVKTQLENDDLKKEKCANT